MTALDTQDDAAPPDEPEAVVDEDVKPETGKDVKPETADGGAARPAARGKPRLQLEELVVGAETRGKVVGLSKFGAFVDIGAVTDGLVHISELSDRRVRNVEDVVKSGDTVDVWVKDVDLKKKRISLSMRKKPDRPMDTLKPGAVVAGKVTSVTKYGAFVDIGAETEGLVHVSEMSSGFVQAPSELVEVGKDVEVRVKEIDRRRERISLSMKGLTDDEGDYVIEEEDDEPMPTAMELALRKALGGGEADGEESEGDVEVAAAGDSEMGDVYARMLEEYRASQDDE